MRSLDLQALKDIHWSVLCAFQTNGSGELEGVEVAALRQTIGLEIDVLMSSIKVFGRRNFGGLRVAVLNFEQATVVLGRTDQLKGCVGVVADGRQGLGLLLARIEQLISARIESEFERS